VISLPSLSSRRVSSGSMMVGTWAMSPAPTTSPMSSFLPSVWRYDRVLHVRVEIERPGAALAADARLLRTAERRSTVAHEEAIDPDGSRDEPVGHALRVFPVAGDDDGGEAELGAVREFDHLLIGREGLHGEHRAEHLLGEDLAARLRAADEGRPVVQAAEVDVGLSAEQDGRAIRLRLLDKPGDSSLAGRVDLR